MHIIIPPYRAQYKIHTIIQVEGAVRWWDRERIYKRRKSPDSPQSTVKRKNLVAIIFGGFENIPIWWRFNLAMILEERGWARYFVHLVNTNFGKFHCSPISPNKSSPIIYRFTVTDSYDQGTDQTVLFDRSCDVLFAWHTYM